jgi:putative transposase
MFTTFLAYKLKEQGKQLIKIDKWFSSTKTGSSCGNTQPMPNHQYKLLEQEG